MVTLFAAKHSQDKLSLLFGDLDLIDKNDPVGFSKSFSLSC
jgi:hypothetical protein